MRRRTGSCRRATRCVARAQRRRRSPHTRRHGRIRRPAASGPTGHNPRLGRNNGSPPWCSNRNPGRLHRRARHRSLPIGPGRHPRSRDRRSRDRSESATGCEGLSARSPVGHPPPSRTGCPTGSSRASRTPARRRYRCAGSWPAACRGGGHSPADRPVSHRLLPRCRASRPARTRARRHCGWRMAG